MAIFAGVLRSFGFGERNGKRTTGWTPKMIWYGIGNLSRWAIIALLFVFLLTMAIVLTEVMAFQNRVVEQVGDGTRARNVVLMLHRIQGNPDAYPEVETLPFAAVAVFLDRVRSAQGQLGQFREMSSIESSGQEDAKGVENESDEEQYVKERARLNDSLNELRRVLIEVEPQVVVAEELQKIEVVLAGLERFELPDNATADAKEQIKLALRHINASIGLPEVVNEKLMQLKESATKLEQSLGAVDSGQFSDEAEQVRHDIDAVRLDLEKGIPTGDAPIILTDGLTELESAVSGIKQSPNMPDAAADEMEQPDRTSAVALMVEQINVLREDLSSMKQVVKLDPLNVELNNKLDEFEESIDVLFEMRLKTSVFSTGESDALLVRRRVEPKEEVNEGGNVKNGDDRVNDDYGAALGNIGRAQSELDRKLTSRFGPNYTVAKELAKGINTMRDETGVFRELKPKNHVSADAKVSEGKAADEAYQRTLTQLTQGFADLERSLSNRTRVVAVGNVIRSDAEESEEHANTKARTILDDFDALNRFRIIVQPFSSFVSEGSTLGQIGFNPQKLATLSTLSITTIYIFMIGAIGSLIYIAKYFIGQALQGRSLTDRPDRPLSWLVFRPFFGVVVAFALYLVIQAGQLAFGTNGEEGFGTDLNIPIISVVALFAGLLSWHALAAIESRGRTWFGAQTRQPLWATGLSNALKNENKTIGACAAQVGRSPEQIERWLMFVDEVTVEMQDRLTTWLKRETDELFGEQKPAHQLGGEMLWATGLRLAIDSGPHRLDATGLAELLHEDDELRVQKWLDLKLQVSPAMQWKLVDALGVPHHRLFGQHIDSQPVWATQLRQVMADRKLSAHLLDERLELGDIARIYAWKELDIAVPVDLQDDLVDALDVPHAKLFHLGDLGADFFLWAHGLGEILDEERRSPADLAKETDVEPDRVTAWIQRHKSVAPATRKCIAAYLGRKEEDIFKSYREQLAAGDAPDGGGSSPGDDDEGPDPTSEDKPSGER